MKADDLVAIRTLGLADDRADDRVEPGAVTTAGEDTDAHLFSFVVELPTLR